MKPPSEPAAVRQKRPRKKRRELQVIGWREYVGLPELSVSKIKAKIDTGARSSAIHAWNIVPFEQDGSLWVQFELHPIQRNNQKKVTCTAPVTDQRLVTSSTGHREERFLITTDLKIGKDCYPIEMTLTNRDEMGFRLLLGRTSVRRRFIVDPGRSFLLKSRRALLEKGKSK